MFIFLIITIICLLSRVSSEPQFTFFNPHARYNTSQIHFFAYNISYPSIARSFIGTRDLIGHATVKITSIATPRIPVMDSDTSNYALFDALGYINEYRGNHVIMLEFENKEDFHESRWTLKYYNKNWIWLQVAVVQGPQGSEPTFNGADLELQYHIGMASKVWICYEFTTGLREPYGYTDAHMTQLAQFAFNGNLSSTEGGLQLDIVHASHSINLPDDTMKNKMKFVIFKETPGTDEKNINYKILFGVIKRLGLEKTYLNVRPSIRKTILDMFAIKIDDE